MFTDKKIVVMISGGIAAYKSIVLVRGLQKLGAQVRVAMTESATGFIVPKTLAVLTNAPVLTDLFASDDQQIGHIELSDWADLMIVAPATANLIGKMANGIADDAVSSVLSARHVPTFVVPAMNVHMWENPALQRNLSVLKADGVHIIEPAVGLLAEGYEGKGRLAEPEDVIAQLEAYLNRDMVLAGRRVLISAGGTIEPIDPVRFIGNRSSGKMGYALAEEARQLGADVTLVTTVKRAVHADIHVLMVETAQQLDMTMKEQFDAADIVIMAAAVADFRVAEIAEHKMKKTDGDDTMTLSLVKNPDILAGLSALKTHQYMVGFAAETQNVIDYAQKKLAKKRVDMIVANDVSQENIGFAHDTNAVSLVTENQVETLPLATKNDIAHAILMRISERLQK
ncbi:bifunctional phosphopantothenoylcysteine decarboxylase/phosphopantothenate--cysteine ligase CoaBC [Weissella tructae]|uniref:Coenzyme A biosynthesis bifunctional protein CoaBC n=2 Tax=Weissella TaxID=46255 RepID=A0A075TY86_9LACO|nr:MULTISPECIES: bifunctional phosphopantothenoylcysteine decarboxylase/phosphopantothenate--cysteine ligase CoaBC [Weissella]AIG65301.1 CoaBC protein [Weissella tructae]AIM62615.1 CoaBC protein [Weissella ceti]AIM63950.1 CoaBC protein [Weissella ceti]ELA07706.1 CoaBC protein [Weissella ceti NC36]QVV91683.1 bifunctional phosphopantothenoylcysteine decarboxylase/phosphopantothenate--cysteine ligase CoaBC [Weissella tructae]